MKAAIIITQEGKLKIINHIPEEEIQLFTAATEKQKMKIICIANSIAEALEIFQEKTK